MRAHETLSQVVTEPRMTGWVVLGVLLSIGVYYAVTDRYQSYLQLVLFLPLVTAIMAHRHGRKVFTLLTALAVPAVLGQGWDIADRLSVHLHIPQWLFLLSIVTAVIFCRPGVAVSPANLVTDRFRWARWLLPVALWLMLLRYMDIEFELGDDFTLETNVGAIALATLLALCVDWHEFGAAFRDLVLTSERRWSNALRTAIWCLAGAGLVLNASWEIAYVYSGGFEFADSLGIMLVAVLAGSALAKVDWRIAVLAVAAILLARNMAGPLYGWIEAAVAIPEPPPDSTIDTTDEIERIIITGPRIAPRSLFFSSFFWFGTVSSLCFALLGAAVVPALKARAPELLKSERAARFGGPGVVYRNATGSHGTRRHIAIRARSRRLAHGLSMALPGRRAGATDVDLPVSRSRLCIRGFT